MIGWMMDQWLGLASLAIAVAALVYAALAYNLSKYSVAAARASELLTLRLQAHSGHAEVQRSFQMFQSHLQTRNADWDRYEARHFLSPRLRREAGPRGNTLLAQRAASLCRTFSQRLEAIDGMDAGQLESCVQDARGVALAIEGLIPQLEGPPVLQ